MRQARQSATSDLWVEHDYRVWFGARMIATPQCRNVIHAINRVLYGDEAQREGLDYGDITRVERV